MKKAILVLTLLLFVGVKAQDQVNTSNFELKDRFGRALSPVILISPYDSLPYFNNFTYIAIDSIVGTRDTLHFDFNRYTETGELDIYNYGADDDTLVFETLFDDQFSSGSVGLLDLKADTVIANNELIIIDNGKSKRFKILEDYPAMVRIRRPVNTGQAADRIRVGFIAKSK